jgi:hypothetical protein
VLCVVFVQVAAVSAMAGFILGSMYLIVWYASPKVRVWGGGQ